MKVLCVFGRHQYGDPTRGEGVEYSAFIPALKGLGHEIRHFESWDRTAHADFAELNRRLLDTVADFHPDVLFTVHMEYEIWVETLDAIRARGDVATISWAADDSWKYREVSRFLGPSYHAMTTTYDYMLPMYRADGMAHVLLTQWAASRESLVAPLPALQCCYPVSFVGAAHGDRRARIECLRAVGIDVVCFGHGWENGPVTAREMARIMRESIISLNFANSKGADQIKARCFEVPGSGGFLLTELVPGIERYYVIDEEIVTFDSDDEMVRKVRHFLSQTERRDRIAIAGYRRTAAEHTYHHRLQAVLDFAISAKLTSVSPEPPDFTQAVARYHRSRALRWIRLALVALFSVCFGPARGLRAARRFVFELSWRLTGRRAFSASGWAGRMFPDL